MADRQRHLHTPSRSLRRVRSLVAAALVIAAAACAPPTPEPSPVRRVVLIVLDAAQAGQFGAYGGHEAATPFLDEIAARGATFTGAHSVTTWTLPSTASLMTGLRPERHGVVQPSHVLPEALPVLAGHFVEAGIDTASLVQMIFASDRHGLDRGFNAFEYLRPGNDADLAARLDNWVERTDDETAFLYVHVRRPHSPYTPSPESLEPFALPGHPLADGQRDKALRFIDNARDPQVDARDIERLEQLYRGNLRQADTLLANAFASWLPRIDDDVLFVITSDHGEGLGEHGHFGHGRTIFREHVRIPLIVAGPGIVPGVIDTPVSTLDIAPTLVDLLDLPDFPEGDGRSIAPALRANDRATLSATAPPVISTSRRYPDEDITTTAFDGRWFLRRPARGPYELFDLRDDPDQRSDASKTHPEIVDRLRESTLAATWNPVAAPESSAPAGMSARDREDLQQLGYIEKR